MAIPYNAGVNTKLLLHLDGNSNDSSGLGNNGTDTAVTYGTAYGKFGQGANFNGTSSEIIIADNASLQITNAFTICYWFSSANLTQTNKYTFSKGNDYANLWEYVNNTIEFFGSVTGTDPRTGSQLVIPDTNYHNIIYSYNGTTWASYLDGAVVLSTSRTFSCRTSNATLSIGSAGTNNWSACSIDEFIIENVGWTAAQVTAYYNAVAGGSQAVWFFLKNTKTLWDKIGGIYVPKNTGVVTI
jgi:hypothetical protein